MVNNYSFNVHIDDKRLAMTQEELKRYADLIGLDRIASARYSWMFVLDIFLHHGVHGIDPTMVVDEIKALENRSPGTGTKAATMFQNEPLRGLWHKHFFASRFVAKNIQNQLAGDKLRKLVDEVFDPQKSSIISQEMTNKLAHKVISESIEQRASNGKLTGEWIIFAKYNNENYYLCLSTHNSGDQMIYERIKSTCFPQFPFLCSKP